METLHPLQAKTAKNTAHQHHDIAVMVVLWIMLAGFCVVAANAWASGWMA